jgi:hypothetical protein
MMWRNCSHRYNSFRNATTFISAEEFQSNPARKSVLSIAEVVALTAGGLVARLWLSRKEKESVVKVVSGTTNRQNSTTQLVPVEYAKRFQFQSLGSLGYQPRGATTTSLYTPQTQREPDRYDVAQSIISRNDGEYYFMLAIYQSKLPPSPKRNQTICQLFERAAKVGHVDAAFNAGLCYDPRSSIDCEKDINCALVYFKQAANEGHVRAQFRLGMLIFLKCKTKEEMEKGI